MDTAPGTEDPCPGRGGAPSRRWLRTCLPAFAGAALMLGGCASAERALLFHPTHDPEGGGLAHWEHAGTQIGYARLVEAPRSVWLLLHGNAGQASGRAYALPSFSSADSVFIMEYPGYGSRPGTPSREAFDQAARQAYLLLRERFPGVPVCVAGESIGTGPASYLATLERPPDKIVLIVPFDRLNLVAAEHFPAFLVGLLLSDNWDNIASLSKYRGPVDIFGAESDEVIPVAHARALSQAVRGSRFHLIEGGHNTWSAPGRVEIRNP